MGEADVQAAVHLDMKKKVYGSIPVGLIHDFLVEAACLEADVVFFVIRLRYLYL